MTNLDKLERISRLVSPPEHLFDGEVWPVRILRRIQRKAARR